MPLASHDQLLHRLPLDHIFKVHQLIGGIRRVSVTASSLPDTVPLPRVFNVTMPARRVHDGRVLKDNGQENPLMRKTRVAGAEINDEPVAWHGRFQKFET